MPPDHRPYPSGSAHVGGAPAGRSRFRPGEIILMTAAWVAVFAVGGALIATGASNGLVYGTYPAAVPLITAARADWRPCGSGCAVAITGVIAVFAGPVGAWAVAGAGICLELLASAA